MPDRTKVAHVSVEDGSPHFVIFSPPDGTGHQAVAAERTVDLSGIKDDLYAHCAAIGFASIAAQKYTLKSADGSRPDVSTEIDKLLAAMTDGSWQPGRAAAAKEPSAFVEALANLSGTPVHVVEQRMKDDKATFTKSYIRTLRFDPAVAAEVAKINKARADRDAKAALAAGKSAKETVDLKGIFAQAA